MFLTIKLCTHAKLNFLKTELIICIKMELALNNLQKLMCHKTEPTNPPRQFSFCLMDKVRQNLFLFFLIYQK